MNKYKGSKNLCSSNLINKLLKFDERHSEDRTGSEYLFNRAYYFLIFFYFSCGT